jgi:hypothetical protein
MHQTGPEGPLRALPQWPVVSSVDSERSRSAPSPPDGPWVRRGGDVGATHQCARRAPGPARHHASLRPCRAEGGIGPGPPAWPRRAGGVLRRRTRAPGGQARGGVRSSTGRPGHCHGAASGAPPPRRPGRRLGTQARQTRNCQRGYGPSLAPPGPPGPGGSHGLTRWRLRVGLWCQEAEIRGGLPAGGPSVQREPMEVSHGKARLH